LSIARKAAKHGGMKLDRDRIVEKAFALLEADGLDAFSVRRLASRLGVQPPALYWHVPSKAELVTLMARRLYAEAREVHEALGDWRGWLLAFGHGLRGRLLAHRDGARLCAIAEPDRAATAETRQALAAPLIERGLPENVALSRLGSVIALALGWTIYEQNGGMHDYLEALFDFDASFAASLEAMIAGFAREA
jgi:TetR/AcrR family tetracycline transcriptional repressor